MMRKKWLAGISLVAISVLTLMAIAFAGRNKNDEDSYLYFIDGVQVEAEDFPNYGE